MKRTLSSVVLLALVGCSSTHLSVDEDAGPIALMDSGPGRDSGATATVDAARLPGVDAWDPGTTTPDAWSPMMMGDPDAWIPTPGEDAGSPMTVDAGPPGVACGTELCVDPQICCVSFSGGPGGGGMSSMMCTAPADCMGVAASCDGPEDCATGEACCGMRTMGGGSTGCVPDAMCRFGRICHADSDCTGRDTCCDFMGASVCSPFCP